MLTTPFFCRPLILIEVKEDPVFRPLRIMPAGLLCACVFIAVPASASPITFGNNAYEFIPGAFSFNDANTAAQAQTFEGVSGHLVTILSAEEDAFVLSLIASVEHSVWIGASECEAPKAFGGG